MDSAIEPVWDEQTWDVVERVINRWEQESCFDSIQALCRLIPPHNEPARRAALVTLINVDQEKRWRTGQRYLLEEYLEVWPELSDDLSVLEQLVQAEYRTRCALGAKPSETELSRRFPLLAGRLNLDSVDHDETCGMVPPLSQPDSSRASQEESPTGSLAERLSGNAELGPGQRFGHYRILEVIGRGGMGTVFRAMDTVESCEVALKVPLHELQADKEVAHRFRREARAASQIAHPNVCGIYDAGKIDETYYVAMQLITGPTLAAQIEKHSVVPCDAAWMICRIADGLAAVHDAGIVHRDVKSANIMLQRSGEPVLMDFGLVLLDRLESYATASGVLVGSVPFVSPEIVQGEQASAASDIYSLGVVLYHALTGSLPFRGKFAEILHKIQHVEPRPPREINSEVDSRLQDICLRAMAKNPAQRFPSAKALGAALSTCAGFDSYESASRSGSHR